MRRQSSIEDALDSEMKQSPNELIECIKRRQIVNTTLNATAKTFFSVCTLFEQEAKLHRAQKIHSLMWKIETVEKKKRERENKLQTKFHSNG